MITLDTVRADALGGYGQPLPTTPALDALAAEGVLFEQVVTSSPSTLPSHTTLFTGLQPYAHGVRANSGYRVSTDHTTLAEVLRARGYQTHAEIAAPVLDARSRLDQGFEGYRSPRSEDDVLDALDEQARGGSHYRTRDAETITREAVAFLRDNAKRPFFLWLHYFDAHQPHDPPQAFLDRIPTSPYHAEIARIDEQIGLVVDEIERLGLRERTLVVVTADHGEGLGEHGEDTHSFFVYDATMRVPLVLWGPPELPTGRRVAQLVRVVDVAPTVLDLLGLPALPDAMGVSLRPTFTQSPGRDLALTGYGESLRPTVTFGSSPLRFVREGKWKYLHKLDPELYDVLADPSERHDVANQNPQIVARLRGRLEALLREAPAGPGDASVGVDAETAAQLQALGYAGGDASQIDDELASLEVRGPDPSGRIGDVRTLATALGHLRAGRTAEAATLARQVVEHNPDSPFPHDVLVKAVLRQDDPEPSIAVLRRGIELDPTSLKYRMSLQALLREQGDLNGAEALLREAVALDRCAIQARLHLSNLLHARKDYAGQMLALEGVPVDCEGSVRTRNALAYALATTPDDQLRDGARALALAEVAVRESRGGHPGYLDTLACAYAEQGRFADAIKRMRRATQLIAGRQVPEELRVAFREHLAAFEAGRPVREP